MQQFSYVIRRADDVAVCIEKFRANAPEKYTSLLITVFTTSVEPAPILALTQRLGDAFPQAVIAGCMTTDVIRNGGVNVNASVVSFSVFRTSTVQLEIFSNPETLAEDGKAFYRRAKRVKNLAAVGIIGTLHALDLQPFLNNLSALDENIVIFGGGANTTKNAPACVFTKGQMLEEGFLAITYAGPELHVHASRNFGWKPLGREFVITKMTGNHIVEEIDHQPAVRIYENYLGILPGKNFDRDTLAFPVFVRRGNSYIARHTVGCRPDGSLLFIADMHEGETLRLAYGDPREMIGDAQAGCADMAAFRPEGIFLLSCFAHRMFLRGDVKLELAPVRNIAPSYGFYTYGEIFRFARSVGIHNMLLLNIGFREGEKPSAPLPVKNDTSTRLKDSLLLVERLVRFVSATTAELESANKELNRMARTDRLTQIANRGETEAILQEAVAIAAVKGAEPLSVLMLDIDDFKKVNDIYGHDVGDQVLTETAQVLRSQVRLGDTVGRWGGEEFLIILPKATEKDAARVAERIRKAIANIHALPHDRSFTASFGVARVAPGETFDEFYRRVDSALYDAKNSGKNCVRVAPMKKA
jgi:diguanylate cyclase (GGDEF)-like protein